jgi:hypothetical protein
MSNVEAIGFIFTVLFYMLGSVIAYAITYNELCDAISNAYIGSSIVSKKDNGFVRNNRRQLAFVVAVLWIFFYAFRVWKLIGKTIYDAFIIKDNEEDRIAAWVV